MGKLITLIPMFFNIIKRGKSLATLAQSKTTKAQYVALLIAGVCVAAVGYFVPQVGDSDVAVSLIVLAAPVVSRLLLYKGKLEEKIDDISAVPPDAVCGWVKYAFDSLWRPVDMTAMDAAQEGYKFAALQSDGREIDLETMSYTGQVLKPTRTPKDSLLQEVMESGLGTRQKGDGSKYGPPLPTKVDWK